MPKQHNPNRRFQIRNAGTKAEIFIYGAVGDDYWDGVSAVDFRTELRDAGDVSEIDVRINSPGGSVYEGMTIYNLLAQHKADVTVYIDGLAASIAAVIAMSGDKIVIAENSTMMIHNASSYAWGTAEELRTQADVLEQTSDRIAQVFVARTGKSLDDVKVMMDAETWISGSEAVDQGFADELAENKAVAACIDSDRFKFKHTPAALLTGFHAEIPGDLKATESSVPPLKATKPAALPLLDRPSAKPEAGSRHKDQNANRLRLLRMQE